jgi:hypothetical protein
LNPKPAAFSREERQQRRPTTTLARPKERCFVVIEFASPLEHFQSYQESEKTATQKFGWNVLWTSVVKSVVKIEVKTSKEIAKSKAKPTKVMREETHG